MCVCLEYLLLGGTLVGGGGGGIGKKELTVAGLDIHTPLGVSSKQQNKNSGGLPYDIATPANMQAHTSSM